ncbi:MAG TPA: dienelactone hydrolase family protein [Caulobacteraceae bacterium]|jgi:dienelactone hydrolase|nr:dienelactone hydrolase family protein [Caulobacteraceae bacterium]
MTPLRSQILTVLAIVALIAAGAAATIFTMIQNPRWLAPSARIAHARFMAPGLQLVTPPGPGPFPTVLLIHGCGGLNGIRGPNPIMDEYAQSAVQAGWAAAILDSYSPRQWQAAWARTRVCSGLRLPGFRRAADVLAGLDLLQADPRVDHQHVRIASWSHGGWAVGDLVTLRDPGDGGLTRSLSGVEAILFTYPYCGFPAQGGKRDWTWKGQVRAAFAGDDRLQPAVGCAPMLDRAREAGAQVETVTYSGATHAFDERVKSPDSPFKFDAPATARAHADFIIWLKTPVSPAPPRVSGLASKTNDTSRLTF